MKVADIKLEWDKSVSTDLKQVEVSVTVDGVTVKSTFPPEVQEFAIEVAANKSWSFNIKTIDKDGLEAMSVTFSDVTGDLELPQPATNLRATIMGIRDVPDPPTE